MKHLTEEIHTGPEKVHSDLTAEQLKRKAAREKARDPFPIKRIIQEHKQAPQNVYAEMVKLAMPILEAYHVDLYHDAHELRARDWTRSDTFFYCVGDCGTNIANNWTDAQMHQRHGRPTVYRFTYSKSDRVEKWYDLTIVEMDGQPVIHNLKP